MALRVLLADESATIKKVMQISLQDFAVDVRAVQLGVDVLQVAQQFKPDIIFVDILLQKKNGYEVSQELKKDPLMRATPVVLMWSGFMEVDIAKLKASMADSQLEKPFDADGLRALVQKFVPKTQAQNLSQHLVFPEVPKVEATQTQTRSVTKTQYSGDLDLDADPGTAAFVTETVKNQKTAKAQPAKEPETEVDEESWSMDSFESLGQFGNASEANDDGFKKVGLGKVSEETATKSGKGRSADSDEDTGGLDLTEFSNEDSWVQKDLSSFKVDLPDGDDEPIALDFDVPDEELEDLINTQTKPMVRPPSHTKGKAESQSRSRASEPVVAQAPSPEEIEKIIRSQSQEIIEKIVKKLVPDLASQLIKEEIRRLLDESP